LSDRPAPLTPTGHKDIYELGFVDDLENAAIQRSSSTFKPFVRKDQFLLLLGHLLGWFCFVCLLFVCCFFVFCFLFFFCFPFSVFRFPFSVFRFPFSVFVFVCCFVFVFICCFVVCCLLFACFVCVFFLFVVCCLLFVVCLFVCLFVCLVYICRIIFRDWYPTFHNQFVS